MPSVPQSCVNQRTQNSRLLCHAASRDLGNSQAAVFYGGTMTKYSYSLLPVFLQHECVYCGESAFCRDHFETWCVSQSPYVIPCCTNCNNVLACNRHETLGERCAFLVERLSSIHRVNLGVNFTEVKKHTRGGLRNKLRREENSKRRVKDRITQIRNLGEALNKIRLERLRDHSPELDRLISYLKKRWDQPELIAEASV